MLSSNALPARNVDERERRGRSPERRCIGTGNILPRSRLVRFVVGPDGTIVPDVAAKLPGRGIWITADAAVLRRAIAKNLFAKAAKTAVGVLPDLVERVEDLLVERIQDHLGLARRSGTLVLGFDNVERSAFGKSKPQLLVQASDGSEDGFRKLIAAAQSRGFRPPVLRGLTRDELSVALGRENVVHAALFPGPLADRLVLDAERLEGFRPHTIIGQTAPSLVPNERQE